MPSKYCHKPPAERKRLIKKSKQLSTKGYSNRAIARQLNISDVTVGKYLRR